MQIGPTFAHPTISRTGDHRPEGPRDRPGANFSEALARAGGADRRGERFPATDVAPDPDDPLSAEASEMSGAGEAGNEVEPGDPNSTDDGIAPEFPLAPAQGGNASRAPADAQIVEPFARRRSTDQQPTVAAVSGQPGYGARRDAIPGARENTPGNPAMPASASASASESGSGRPLSTVSASSVFETIKNVPPEPPTAGQTAGRPGSADLVLPGRFGPVGQAVVEFPVLGVPPGTAPEAGKQDVSGTANGEPGISDVRALPGAAAAPAPGIVGLVPIPVPEPAEIASDAAPDLAPSERAAEPIPADVRIAVPAPPTVQPARGDIARALFAQVSEAIRPGSEATAEISLSPDELGRVRLALRQTETGYVLTIAAERPETLDLMRRHAQMLAEEFTHIGYGNIAFDFADTGTGGGDAQSAGTPMPEPAEIGAEPEPAAAQKHFVSGVDVRI